jgi:hypothetical protein
LHFYKNNKQKFTKQPKQRKLPKVQRLHFYKNKKQKLIKHPK